MSGDIHTCSYQCDRPACIRAQRDELVAKLDAVTKDSEAIRADIREIYEQIPNLPITPETMDAATDVLTKFCIDFNSTITGSDHE